VRALLRQSAGRWGPARHRSGPQVHVNFWIVISGAREGQGNRLRRSGCHQDGLEERFVEGSKAAFDADAFFLGGFGALEEAQGDVPDGGEVGRSVALSDAALVFAIDDIEQPSPGRLLLTINHNDAARFGEGPPRRTIVAAAARGRWSGSTALFILIEEFATPIGAYQQPSINLKNSPENVKGLVGAT
jgi:hypothetical protein